MISALRNRLEAMRSHPGFRRYAANTSWMMAEKILRMFVGLFVGIWVARYLGPEQFGLLSYAQSFVFLFTAVATLGLDSVVVRELVRDDNRRDELLGTAFTLKLTGALLILPILWIAVTLSGNDAYTSLLVFIVASATIFQSFNVIDFQCQAKVNSKYVALTNSFSLFFSSVIKIIMILSDAPLVAFAIMVTFESFLLAFGLVFYYQSMSGLSMFNWRFRIRVAKSLLKDCWPLIFSGFVVSMYMKIDQIMIKEMVGVQAVGHYAAAVKLSEAWYFIPIVIANSLFPAIINGKKISEEVYLVRLQRLYTLMVWFAVAIALPMTFLSKNVVKTLYGEAYFPAVDVLMIHIWSGIFVFLGVASSKWLINEGLTLTSFLRVFVGLVFNVGLNFLLIPVFGILGAALSILVSQMVAAYIYDVFSHRTRMMFVMKTKAFVMRFK